MRLVKLIGIMTLCVVMSACGNKIKAGVVYEKNYTPESTMTIFIPHRMGKTFWMQPIVQVVPEDWEVKIFSYVDGQKVTAEYSVTEDEYNSIDIGDYWSVD